MSIYSNNRSGVMEMAQVSVNEAYKNADIGTILAETEANDMAFFEAILYSDFNEIQGLREGTLLEAEAKKLNKESIKAFGSKIMDRLQAFLAKIKAMFRAVVEKIASYCAGDGKRIVAAINAHKAGWTGSVENVATYDTVHKAFLLPPRLENALSEAIDNKDLISNYLASRGVNGADKLTAKNYTKAAMDAAKSVKTYDASNIGELCEILTSGKGEIKNFKSKEKEVEGRVNDVAKEVRKQMGMNVLDIAGLNSRVSAIETVIGTITKAGIAAARANIGSARVALAKALTSMRKESKATHEFAIMEAVAELEMAFNCPIEMTPEARSLVESAYC